MKIFITTLVVFLFVLYYIGYSSLSEPIEVSRNKCEEAHEKGARYQQWNDLKTIYPLTEPIYHKWEGKVYQLNADYVNFILIVIFMWHTHLHDRPTRKLTIETQYFLRSGAT